MSQVIEFEGQTHEFPDDFSQGDIAKALSRASSSASAPSWADSYQNVRNLVGRGIDYINDPTGSFAGARSAAGMPPASEQYNPLPSSITTGAIQTGVGLVPEAAQAWRALSPAIQDAVTKFSAAQPDSIRAQTVGALLGYVLGGHGVEGALGGAILGPTLSHAAPHLMRAMAQAGAHPQQVGQAAYAVNQILNTVDPDKRPAGRVQPAPTSGPMRLRTPLSGAPDNEAKLRNLFGAY